MSGEKEEKKDELRRLRRDVDHWVGLVVEIAATKEESHLTSVSIGLERSVRNLHIKTLEYIIE